MITSNKDLLLLLQRLVTLFAEKGWSDLAAGAQSACKYWTGSQTEFLHYSGEYISQVVDDIRISDTLREELRLAKRAIDQAFRQVGGA